MYMQQQSDYESEIQRLMNENESLKIQFERMKDDYGMKQSEANMSLQQELEYYRNKVLEMEADIEVLIQDINNRQSVFNDYIKSNKMYDIEAIRSEYERKFNQLQYELQQARGNQQNHLDLLQQIEVWKKRYMETEVRLKEYDALQ